MNSTIVRPSKQPVL